MKFKKIIYTLSLVKLVFIFLLVNSFTVNAQKRTTLEEPYIPGHIIVQLSERGDLSKLISDLPEEYQFSINRELSKSMRTWLIEFNPEKLDQLVALNLINNQREVTIAQNNHKVELRNVEPNDPMYSNQWHHKNTGQGGGTAGADIQSNEAWGITTGGKNANGDDIVVCILEQVDFSHNDLVANRWINTDEIPGNGIDDDGNGYIDDIYGWNVGNNTGNLPTNSSGHGTSVAGMIGAVGNNDLGVAGANWDVKMMNVVGYTLSSEASVVAAYEYPLAQRKLYNETNGERGAFVVSTNASWGIDAANPDNYPIWCAFYDTLGIHGILNCGATTNQSLDVDQEGDMPTGCTSQYMVGIGRSDRNDNFQGGYGATTINFAAPGVDVLTTANGNSYTTTTGTSFASPLTAGVIALMYSIPCSNFMSIALNNPQEAADLVFNALMDGTDPKPALENNFITGGRLNAKNAIDLLMEEVCTYCSPPISISTKNLGDNSITIDYEYNSDVVSYEIFFKEKEISDWSSIVTSDTSLTISGLNSCKSYEFFVAVACDTEPGDSSQIMEFTTSGCGACTDIEYCNSVAQNPDVAFTILSPDSIRGEITEYTGTTGWGGSLVNNYIFADLVLVDDGTDNPSEGCNELINQEQLNGKIALARRGSCTFIEKALHAQNAGAIGIIIVNNDGDNIIEMGGQDTEVTIPVRMITEDKGNELIGVINNDVSVSTLIGQQNEWIASFEFNGEVNENGDNNGYKAPTIPALEVTQGKSYTFTITPGFSGQPLDQYSRIWIDFNQDGEFASGELVYDQLTPSNMAVTDSIVIPDSVSTGTTRMRIQMAYQGVDADSLPDNCGNYTSGEVEDYCIKITNNTVCNFELQSSVVNPACNTIQNGEIEVEVMSQENDYEFIWSNGVEGETRIDSLIAGNYELMIINEDGCDTLISYSLSYTTLLNVNAEINQPSCESNSDGSIMVEGVGAPEFTYLWANGNNTAFNDDLLAGNYQVTITADNGCKIEAAYSLNYTTDLKLTPLITHPTCDYTDDGAIVVEATGGDGITYQWTDGPDDPIWSLIGEGVYEITATADNDCSISKSYELIAVNSNAPIANFSSTTNFLEVSFSNQSAYANLFEWDFGDSTTVFSFNASHIYADSGTYTVCLTATGNCEETTTCQDITVEKEDLNSINNETLNENITAYPNPARDILNFEIGIEMAHSIELRDATGKLVSVHDIEQNLTVIELNRLVTGFYIYTIKDKNNNTLYVNKVSVVK